mgnify:CR=1 FL=1
MSYLLDTPTLAEVLRATPNQGFVRRLSQIPPHERYTSAITVSQLLLAARLDQSAKLMQDVIQLVAAIRVAAYDLNAAQRFAKFRAAGATQQTDDVMVAAIAISRDFTLVSSRRRVFRGFEGLRLEDWTSG